jgi:hypothetical protein
MDPSEAARLLELDCCDDPTCKNHLRYRMGAQALRENPQLKARIAELEKDNSRLKRNLAAWKDVEKLM